MESEAESSCMHKAPGPAATSILSAQTVAIQNGGVLSASTSGIEPGATGGQISVLANQSVTLSNGGSIVANSTGPANAGSIAINAGAQFLSQKGAITTTANQASGGNITIQATDSIRLVNSQLSTSVQGGPTPRQGAQITLIWLWLRSKTARSRLKRCRALAATSTSLQQYVV